MTSDEFRRGICPLSKKGDKRIAIEEGEAYMFYDEEIWVVGRCDEHAKTLTIVMIESEGYVDTMPVSRDFTLPATICRRM